MEWACPLLAALCLVAVDAQGDCGANIVPFAIFPVKPCTLRATRDDLNASDAELQEETRVGLEKGEQLASKLLEHEDRVSRTLDVEPYTPEYHHYLTNMASDSDRLQARDTLEDLANATALARHLSRKYNIPPEAMGDLLVSICVPADPSRVQQVPTCNASDIYRAHDASCNNLEHPTWGMTDTPYVRLLTSKFSDGINKPKKSVTGKELPNPRFLRTRVFPTGDFNDKIDTLLTMQFGQIIAHDTALSADWVGTDGLGIECCSHDATPLPCNNLSVGCYPIKIPHNDEYYARKGVKCMSVARSMKRYTVGGCLGPAEVVNSINHMLDLSMTYGPSKDQADQLREFVKGLLKTQVLSDGRKVLPQVDNPVQTCSLRNSTETCFLAGDPRVNQNTQLTALQVILLREHNRVATELSSINPHWDDETIYQEARRVVIAEYEHVVYNEYLRQILGGDLLEKYHLLPSKTGFSNCYNSSIHPGTSTEFTHAIFRLFHGTAQSDLVMYKDIGCPVGKIKIGRWMDKPEIIVQDDHFDEFILGLTQQPATKRDRYSVYELNRNLFRVDQRYGQDLPTFDLIRGRDTGLQNYNDYRELCGLPRAKKFEDFSDLMSYEDIITLSHYYEHPDDVELMMVKLEQTNRRTLSVWVTILLDQFYRWKCGDRFFYDYSGSPYPFTLGQINEIKKVSMARLLCDNSDNLTRIQPNCFQQISSTNEVVNCNEIPVVDLSLWKEDK